MQLSDRDLRALLPEMDIQTPEYAPAFSPSEQVQPASIDLRVDRVVWTLQRLRGPVDLTNKLSARISGRHSYRSDLGARGKFRLAPGDIVMTRTLEEFTVPEGYAAEIFTRSSFGRLGISVTCAGYINPGYRGRMPLQIANLGRETIYFSPLIAVCQLVLRKLSSVPERPYGAANLRSKYANDDGGPSRWWMDSIIKQSQESLGATNMPDEAQQKLLGIILLHDLSTQFRFERFLSKAKATELESVDSTLDAFARREVWSLTVQRLLKGAGGLVALLVAASVGAFFSTPFNETKYGLLHVSLWAITVVATAAYAPVFYKKLTAREVDFLLPQDVDQLRVSGQTNGGSAGQKPQ